jgi:hypothetical protein
MWYFPCFIFYLQPENVRYVVAESSAGPLPLVTVTVHCYSTCTVLLCGYRYCAYCVIIIQYFARCTYYYMLILYYNMQRVLYNIILYSTALLYISIIHNKPVAYCNCTVDLDR